MGVAIDSEDGKIELFRGPYSGFGRFRQEVANSLGCMNYGKHIKMAIDALISGLSSNPSNLSLSNFQKQIESQRDAQKYQELSTAEFNVLYRLKPYARTFFEHSDCDGAWTPEDCKDVQKLLTDVQDDFPSESKQDFDKFMRGLAYCVANELGVTFH